MAVEDHVYVCGTENQSMEVSYSDEEDVWGQSWLTWPVFGEVQEETAQVTEAAKSCATEQRADVKIQKENLFNYVGRSCRGDE